MIDFEITSSADVIPELADDLRPHVGEVRQYNHRGLTGEAAVYGMIVSLLTATLPKLLEVLKPRVARDRNLKISLNGLEILARDVGEATEIVDLLKSRNLLPKED